MSADSGTRTRGLRHGTPALSPSKLHPRKKREPGGTRTHDNRLKRTALFQLSYGPVKWWGWGDSNSQQTSSRPAASARLGYIPERAAGAGFEPARPWFRARWAASYPIPQEVGPGGLEPPASGSANLRSRPPELRTHSTTVVRGVEPPRAFRPDGVADRCHPIRRHHQTETEHRGGCGVRTHLGLLDPHPFSRRAPVHSSIPSGSTGAGTRTRTSGFGDRHAANRTPPISTMRGAGFEPAERRNAPILRTGCLPVGAHAKRRDHGERGQPQGSPWSESLLFGHIRLSNTKRAGSP